MKNLYIAYAATWLIHIAYVLYLGRKASRLRQEMREFAAEEAPVAHK